MPRMLLACLTVCTVLAAGTAWPQTYPSKTVRIIVPAATGGPDVVARLVAAQLTAQTGQSFIVENKPGANGILGIDAVAKAPPDGYTLMVYSSGFVINPAIYKKLPYDTERDFVPVTNIVINDGLFIVVNPAVPARTLRGVHRARACAGQQGGVQLARRRQSAPPRRGAVQRARGHEDAARPVQGRRTRGGGGGRGRSAGDVLLARAGDAASEERPRPRHRLYRTEAASGDARRPDDDRGGPRPPTRSTAAGSACSRRRTRRPRSSTSSSAR